ncbi:1-acyl-sn-glycerol-3-phosphate acyltransferase [Limosilactobacillus gastricus]|uniref:1-acyl-sn-glycerol-3-phosphate acyltransferase n=1 Tax=Limosilactobacillus gastricus DSM 16045 TaxID=1423749 RepID=A0A0R1VAK3_9LACO|nr:1-acyl-sn-glycerol-3-phosphate acyltransferase [Limosilactobacillus gastricus]KRM02522.1 1-acyl-sn-glycerol-3-phosphate acyltransferase [Limosilactobacillus gastricus DSM 16045]QGF40241.1 1-acyl-sn-glycerol-3-phosphate acyltransferase [Limosilactobacillus gastricus]
MLYRLVYYIFAPLLALINLRQKVYNKENLPQGNYVLVAPHRTWMDPPLLALAAYPKQFGFMAKQELFKNPVGSWIIRSLHAYPVDRKNPGMSAIKGPVKMLKDTELSTIIFPTGSRYSKKMKGGALLIAKMANVPVVPAVYQGPTNLKELFSWRNRRQVAFGQPIYIDRKTKLTDEVQADLEAQIQAQFDQLDHQINPNYHYQIPKK